MDIQPIETLYKGYRFRSRLEARWAVFFESIGTSWEYEKEGFEVGGGVRYLPDFFLPVQNLWVEIKPNGQDKYDRSTYSDGMKKWGNFVRDDERKIYRRNAVVCTGNPRLAGVSDYHLFFVREGTPLGQYLQGHWAIDSQDEKSLWIFGEDGACQLNAAATEHDRWPSRRHPLLLKAYEVATSARFEHGETPKV